MHFLIIFLWLDWGRHSLENFEIFLGVLLCWIWCYRWKANAPHWGDIFWMNFAMCSWFMLEIMVAMVGILIMWRSWKIRIYIFRSTIFLFRSFGLLGGTHSTNFDYYINEPSSIICTHRLCLAQLWSNKGRSLKWRVGILGGVGISSCSWILVWLFSWCCFWCIDVLMNYELSLSLSHIRNTF